MNLLLIAEVVPLGIGAAFTPSLLAMQLLVCSGDPWRRRALAILAGNAVAFGIFGLLVILGFSQLPLMAAGRNVGGLVRLIAGVCCLAAAVYLFIPHPTLQARVEGSVQGYVARASAWAFLGIAFAFSIKDVSSFVMLVPALHDIAVEPHLPSKVVALAVLYALALSPVLVPPVLRLLLDRRAHDPMQRLYRFTMDHQFPLVGGVAALIGGYLVVSGVALA